ncbi:HAD family phosphatase [Gaetbulibacter sp. M240]|uniref:HAD family hydrolase n=1 Tax=Gaetbulibacter sp. M240 TaxID=3126511 RepID=UPI00374E4319
MVKAVIFDMDGVIINSEPLHRKAYNQMFENFKIQVPDALYESFTGQSTINICKRLVDHFKLPEDPETMVALKRKYFDDLFNNDKTFDLIDGVRKLIEHYHEKGLTLVLGSSASRAGIERIFDRFQLNPYFKAKLSGAELKASKPHPEIFVKAAEASGYDISECVVIEDSTNGIIAAKAAGIFSVAYDSFHSKNQDYSEANLVITDFEAIYVDALQEHFKKR